MQGGILPRSANAIRVVDERNVSARYETDVILRIDCYIRFGAKPHQSSWLLIDDDPTLTIIHEQACHLGSEHDEEFVCLHCKGCDLGLSRTLLFAWVAQATWRSCGEA
jgi:hypothetical protein